MYLISAAVQLLRRYRDKTPSPASQMHWSIPFDQEAEEALFRSLIGGAIISLAEETGGTGDLVEVRKVLVDRESGFKFEIYADEHPPPHFHVLFGGESNSFSIVDATPLYPDGELRKYFKNIRKWHGSNRDKLVETWNRTRPTGCPVGLIQLKEETGAGAGAA
jgi:hypothetical protein